MLCDSENGRRQIVLHVGYPKTGTTTLQKHFFPYLEEFQYLGKHDEDIMYDFDAEFINRLIFNKNSSSVHRRELQELERNLDDRNAIMSEESFMSNSLRPTCIDGRMVSPKPLDVARNIREFFSEDCFDVKILFGIRRQDDMLVSQYAQSYTHFYSKYKKVDSFGKFLSVMLEKDDLGEVWSESLDYMHVIQCYRRIFGEGNVGVLVFEMLKEEPVSFYRELCMFLGVEPDKYVSRAVGKVENRRQGNSGYRRVRRVTLLEMMVQFKQSYFPLFKINLPVGVKEMARNIKLPENRHVGKTIFLTDEQRKQIIQNYAKSNEQLDKMMGLNLGRYGYY